MSQKIRSGDTGSENRRKGKRDIDEGTRKKKRDTADQDDAEIREKKKKERQGLRRKLKNTRRRGKECDEKGGGERGQIRGVEEEGKA